MLPGLWLGTAHFFIMGLIWFSTFGLLCYLADRFLTLADRATIEIRENQVPFPFSGIVWSLLLFVELTTSRNVSFWFAMAGATILISALWLLYSIFLLQ
jgi:hypothetical protein